jgi:hypothetical protein
VHTALLQTRKSTLASSIFRGGSGHSYTCHWGVSIPRAAQRHQHKVSSMLEAPGRLQGLKTPSSSEQPNNSLQVTRNPCCLNLAMLTWGENAWTATYSAVNNAATSTTQSLIILICQCVGHTSCYMRMRLDCLASTNRGISMSSCLQTSSLPFPSANTPPSASQHYPKHDHQPQNKVNQWLLLQQPVLSCRRYAA